MDYLVFEPCDEELAEIIVAFCREHENIKKINEARISWIGNLEALNPLKGKRKIN